MVSPLLGLLPLGILFYSARFYQRFGTNDGQTSSTNPRALKTDYDFIIIGGGSAGAVIANRLTEQNDWRVLLVEAGGDENILTEIPARACFLQLTKMDWQYQTEPQRNACLALRNRRSLWPRGKVLGGSSALNYMLYVRGNRRDYDHWAELGNSGWSYEDVLPYFIKSEDNQEAAMIRSRFHGTGGYLTVQNPPYQTPLARAFVASGVELGYQHTDTNGASQSGFSFVQGTLRRNARCSTAKAFLRPARKRDNLQISLYSRVLKVLIDSNTRRAYGVRFERNGVIYTAMASKEVILSAGAIGTPQILMLSGIGPADHLESLGIDVIANLSVGDNLQDHVSNGGMVFLVDQPVSFLSKRVFNVPSLIKYGMNRETPLSTLGGVEGVGFVKTKYADTDDDWPDIQFHFVGASPVSDGGTKVRYAHGVIESTWNQYYQPIVNKDTFQIIPTLLRPKSTGYIRLRSIDPYSSPIIDPRYFQDPRDVKVLVEGTKIAMNLSRSQGFKTYGTQFYSKPFPGCEEFNVDSDDYFECFARHYTMTFYHPVGTCKMGPRSDAAAVVDPQLRVYDIEGLRVIDASVMPTIVSGNTNAPTIMIAEKAADFIKSFWNISGL